MDSLSAVHCLHFLTLAALFFSISVAAAVTSRNNTQPSHRLVMKLIHHDSITSPFYNSTESVSADRAERFLRNAIARSMFLDSKASVQAILILDSKYSIFSVKFSVGQPPVPQIALMDTGSSLLWIQCNPCQECFQQSSPIFDSSESSTYKEFPCNDPLCIQFGNARCNSQQRCGYDIDPVEGVSVGEERLDIDPDAFKPDPWGRGGVILDSGSILTRLTENEYNILKQGVDDVAGWKLNRFIRPRQPKMLCYRGNAREEMTGFPAVSFHLAGGADLVMDEESMFFQADTDHFCMSVLPLQPDRKISVIGIMAQQNYNVGYDLDAGMMYLERIDCQLLSD